MRASKRRAAATAGAVGPLAAFVAVAGGAQAEPARSSRAGAPQAQVSLVEVADRGDGEVRAYRSDATGPSTAVRVLTEPSDQTRDPWALATDAAGRLYVQNYLSESTTDVYAPGATTGAAPGRRWHGSSRDAPSIAVAADGTVYVARLQEPGVEVFAPGAPADAPSGELRVDGLPRSVAAGPGGTLYVAVIGRDGGNAVEQFAPGATGAATPLRTITGPRTGLGTAATVLGTQQVVITWSPLTRRLYAAVSGGPAVPTQGVSAIATHIGVFAGTATGNAAPLRTIAGGRTLLAGAALTGVAVNPDSGNVWVMAVRGPGFGQPGTSGALLDFARLADGDVPPLRTVTDAATGFRDVQGITFLTR